MNRPPSGPPPAAVEYVDRALPDSRSTAEQLPDAALLALHDLQARLRTVFGVAGCEVLFRRSMTRAAARHPLLAPAVAESTPESVIDTIRKRVRRENQTDVADAVRDIMTGQISLLARFIGEDLVAVILRTDPEPRPQTRKKGEARRDG